MTERYEYQGVAGALSRKLTLLEFPNNTPPDNFGETFEQTYSYDALARVTSQSYPKCITSPDNFRRYCQDGNETPAADFTAAMSYSHSLPEAVSGTGGLSATYQYHPNLTLKQIDHGNSAVTLFTEDPDHLPRPRRIQVRRFSSTGTVLFDTGVYTFDAAGNIRTIGPDVYVYDTAQRLLSGTVNQAGADKRQDYGYDLFDNLTSIATDDEEPEVYSVNASKNRLIDPNIAYDAAGNMLRFEAGPEGGVKHPSDSYVRYAAYDALNMQSTFRRFDLFGNVVEDLLYIYGPGNYRLFVWDGVALKRHFTFRDAGAKIVRQFEVSGFGSAAQWSHGKDFLHGPSGLIATRTASGLVKYFHHDHLGTPRLQTSNVGSAIAKFHYYPYGAPIGLTNPNDEPAYKFTGHERDRHGVTDYMLGRTYAYPFQRFMSVDPARDGWNLYGYVGGNPIGAVDPDGREGAAIRQDILIRAYLESGRPYAISDPDAASAAMGALPIVGDLKDVQEAATGVDLATGGQLSDWDRLLTLGAAAIPFVGGKVLREGVGFIFRNGDEVVSGGGRAVIGRTRDLQDLPAGERSLLDRLPNHDSPRANWRQNSSVLREEMGRGQPIRDASPGDTSSQFLNAERALLEDHGWTFDSKTNLWMPPGS